MDDQAKGGSGREILQTVRSTTSTAIDKLPAFECMWGLHRKQAGMQGIARAFARYHLIMTVYVYLGQTAGLSPIPLPAITFVILRHMGPR